MTDHGLEHLADLADSVLARRNASADESYTAKLISQGVEKCAKKLGEEAVEAALAAMTGKPQHIASESADVLYHLLVMLAATNVPLSDVMAELKRRQGVSGLAEKASRGKA